MKLVFGLAAFLGIAVGGTAAAETLRTDFAEQAPSGHQKVWHATLDLRDLPPGTRPASIAAAVSVPRAAFAGAQTPRIAISLNGIVIARAWARPGESVRIETEVEDRLLSTRNHVALAVTSFGANCPDRACSVSGAELREPLRFGLTSATEGPVTFAQHVTRFRQGVTLTVADPRDRALAERVVAAIAPHAPCSGPAEIVVSRTAPKGAAAPLRFDNGPVAIKDRDGRLLYGRAALDDYTIVQIARRGDRPLLWVRPGKAGVSAELIQLDYGDVALFGPKGREIAFSPDQDRAVTIAYAADAAREAQTGLIWRLAVVAVWLAITAGLVVVLRRMAPLEPKAV